MADDEGDDWYLREWMGHLGKKQAALVNELGWTKNRANIVWHGKQPYRRDIVNQVATWLKVKPFELLMHPREALALKRLRASAAVIVAEEDPADYLPPPRSEAAAPLRRTASR